jgi:hypothetical protein
MHREFFLRRGDPARCTTASNCHLQGEVHPIAVAALAAVAVLTGCGSPPATEATGELLPDDVPVVHNVESRSRVAEWTVGSKLRVGAVDGEVTFGRVADVAPRAAGGLWVVDAQSRWISGFEEDGSRVVHFGGEGDGPGELRTPSALFEIDDGTVVAGSAFPPVLHRFDAGGSYLGSTRLTESRDANGAPIPPRFADWQMAADGKAVADLFAVPGPGQGSSVVHTLVRFADDDLNGRGRDTIVRWSLPSTPASPWSPIEIVPVRPSWSVGPEGLIWWSPGAPYEIRAYDQGGTPVRAITLDRNAVRVTPAIEEKLISGLRSSAASGPGGAALIEQAIERARWPKFLPQVVDLWVSHPDGRIFALPWTADSFDESIARRLDVFEPEGRYVARLTLPPRFSPRRFANGAVYGVERDQLGVSYAVRYGIVTAD